MKPRTNLLTNISAVVLAASLAACGSGTRKADNTQQEDTRILVKTQIATMEDVERTAEFTSNIEAFKENNIAPSYAARIDRILVDVGDRVSQGQLLVKMDPTQYNLVAVQLANLEADFERMQNVFNAGGISQQQIDQAETQLKVQRDQANDLKTNIELRSPISGVVTARNYDPGDLYAGTPILQVMQISTLKVTAHVSEQYFPDVKNGMPAEIRVDMYPDKVFAGKVSLIYPAIDPATRTFQVEISIPNSGGELRPGMFSRTSLGFGSQPGIMVEDLAVQKQMGSNDKFVYVISNGVAERRLVTTGIQIGNRIHILNGVGEGDEVVVAGFAKLVNGSEVLVSND